MTFVPEWFYQVSMILTSWFCKVSRRPPEVTTAAEWVMVFLHTIMRSKVSLFSSTLSVSTIYSTIKTFWIDLLVRSGSIFDCFSSVLFSLKYYLSRWRMEHSLRKSISNVSFSIYQTPQNCRSLDRILKYETVFWWFSNTVIPLKWGLYRKAFFFHESVRSSRGRKRDQYFNTVPRLLPEIYISSKRSKKAPSSFSHISLSCIALWIM